MDSLDGLGDGGVVAVVAGGGEVGDGLLGGIDGVVQPVSGDAGGLEPVAGGRGLRIPAVLTAVDRSPARPRPGR